MTSTHHILNEAEEREKWQPTPLDSSDGAGETDEKEMRE
ncbi:hypothetical protein BVRB_5g115090 [Beta vulgaris subsp. vulgaris]|nr:hypothetical protein BVRB_5g115090 [Beta vulgaris subsp. vulgaris]